MIGDFKTPLWQPPPKKRVPTKQHKQPHSRVKWIFMWHAIVVTMLLVLKYLAYARLNSHSYQFGWSKSFSWCLSFVYYSFSHSLNHCSTLVVYIGSGAIRKNALFAVRYLHIYSLRLEFGSKKKQTDAKLVDENSLMLLHSLTTLTFRHIVCTMHAHKKHTHWGWCT